MSTVGVALQHLEEQGAHAVILVPDREDSRSPKTDRSHRKCDDRTAVAFPWERGRCFRYHHQRGKDGYSYKE